MSNGDGVSDQADDSMDEEETYEWIAFSECALCNALVGMYSTPPPRPHPYCQCDVIRLGFGSKDPIQCLDIWNFEQVRNDYSGDPLHPDIEMIFNVYVHCWDGGIYEYEEYGIEYDQDNFGTYEFQELQQIADDLAQYNCHDKDCLGVS